MFTRLSSRALLPALLAAVGVARADAAPLAGSIAVACEPALPFFCANIHVSCSGRTDMRTFAFRLRAQDGRGWIETEAGAVRQQYEDARVDWSDGAVLLRPRDGAGYIRLLASGKYSFRYYDAHEAGIMSYGHCR